LFCQHKTCQFKNDLKLLMIFLFVCKKFLEVEW
jgi:hypothetical protein